MGQDTLGDHMHIQSIHSRHRACNIFPPLLDALLINARTVPALSESNSLHPAQEYIVLGHRQKRNNLCFFDLENLRIWLELAR